MASLALRNAPPTDRIQPAAIGVLSGLVGLCSSYVLNIIGEIYLAELLLPVLALGVWVSVARSRQLFRQHMFRILSGALYITLLGYVVSDMVSWSSESQYLRGWARVAVLATNFVSLGVLASADRRNLWWFVLGLGIGGTFYLRFGLHTPISIWKHGYADYVTVAFAALCYFLPARVASLGFVGLAAVSFYWDFRSHGAICFAIAAILWIKANERTSRKAGRAHMMRLLAIGFVVATLGYLGARWTEDDYTLQRREGSNIGRTVGITFGIKAIVNSPIIGYGSWSSGPELDRVAAQAVRESPAAKVPGYSFRGGSLSVHSQFLQAWVEGGILGTCFFIVLAFQLIKYSKRIVVVRALDCLTPILAYYFVYNLWHIAMSPFALGARLIDAFGCVVLLIVAQESIKRRVETVVVPRPLEWIGPSGTVTRGSSMKMHMKRQP